MMQGNDRHGEKADPYDMEMLEAAVLGGADRSLRYDWDGVDDQDCEDKEDGRIAISEVMQTNARDGVDAAVIAAREWRRGDAYFDLVVRASPPALWRLTTLTHYDKLLTPPTSYLVDEQIPKPSLVIVYATPGSFKSMLMMDVCTCVAAGQPWLGRDTKRVPVLWVDAENGAYRVRHRLEALARGHDAASLEDAVRFLPQSDTPLDLMQSDLVDGFIRYAGSLGAGLLVFDNLAALSGDADENSGEMVRVMSNLRRISDELGASVIVIHHPRKSAAGKESAGDAMRGHSSINASVDLALRVRRNSSTVTVDATKVRDADIAPIRAQFRFVHRKDARELEQAWFTDVSDTGVEQKVLAAARKSLAGGNEMKKTDLVAGVKRQMSELGGKKIGALLASASEGGDLRVRNGAHNAQLSSLPSGEDR